VLEPGSVDLLSEKKNLPIHSYSMLRRQGRGERSPWIWVR